MPAASSDDARGASSAASVLAPSEGETEDPRISAYVAHLAHVGDEMAPGLGALFADAFPEVGRYILATVFLKQTETKYHIPTYDLLCSYTSVTVSLMKVR